MRVAKPIWKYAVKTCRTLHECFLCGKDIIYGQDYHDGGWNKRAHVTCARLKRDGYED